MEVGQNLFDFLSDDTHQSPTQLRDTSLTSPNEMRGTSCQSFVE